jgi:photosystem II stability/assembly factor-like uncharacterized protein
MSDAWQARFTKCALLVILLVFSGYMNSVGQQTNTWKVVDRLPSRLWTKVHVDVQSSVDSRPPVLNSIVFIDDIHGWSVGDGGTVLRTADGGETWEVMAIEGDPELTSVFFRSPEKGWTSGSVEGRGVVFETKDGGKTWRIVESVADFRPSSVNSVWFANELDGWAVGYGEKDGAPYGIVFRTKDGGAHWTLQHIEKKSEVRGIAFVDADFIDGRHAVLLGSDWILRTENGGSKWQAFDLPKTRDGDAFFGTDFISPAEGWVVGGMYSGELLHTRDGGMHWESLPVTPSQDRPVERLPTLFIASVKFANPSLGWVGANGGNILSTTNGGRDWAVEETNQDQAIRSLALTSSAIFAVGTKGLIMMRHR